MSDRRKPLVVRSMFGHRTRQPLVVLRLGAEMVQLPPADARALAHHLMEAAEGAMHDACTDAVFQDMGLGAMERAQMMAAFRKARGILGHYDTRLEPWRDTEDGDEH